MAKVLWFSWCGGGNLPPSLGIAQALTQRGHQVVFAGRREMLPRVHAAGFSAVELTNAYLQIDRYPADSPVRGMLCYLTSPAVGAQIQAVARSEAPDITLIDAKFVAALSCAPQFGCPSVVICHTFFFRMLEKWRAHVAHLSEFREQAGFSSLPSIDELWFERKAVIVTTLPEFDPPSSSVQNLVERKLVRHVGPVLEDEKCVVPLELPWPQEDPTPLILISFSSQPEQCARDKFQDALDALAPLPVHVVATTAGILQLEELLVPSNAVVAAYAAHDPVMQRASLVITHGGHGTAMRSLRHGVPMVFLPGIAPDQATVATVCEEWGVGRVVPANGGCEAIRNAAQDILNDPAYRSQAARLAVPLARNNATERAALELETLI